MNHLKNKNMNESIKQLKMKCVEEAAKISCPNEIVETAEAIFEFVNGVEETYRKEFSKNKVEKGISERCSIVSGGRASGRTTRLADYYIQELFDAGLVRIKDHYGTRQSHIALFETVTRRLRQEHKGIQLETDKESLIISIN